MAVTVQRREEEATAADGRLFIRAHRGTPSWFARWYDHAGRLVKSRLGAVYEIGSAGHALAVAREHYDRYVVDHESAMTDKERAAPAEIAELAQRVAFPRAVVAMFILRICERIARYEQADELRIGRPGLQLFSERAKISPREVHRLVEDDERISVGLDTVDKICCEFDLLFDDFISESLDWAARRGVWQDRPGTEDSWPFGKNYTWSNVVDDDDDDLI